MSNGSLHALAGPLCVALALIGLRPDQGLAQEPLGQADGLLTALHEGEGSVQLRYRLEFVDQDGIDEQAWASTLRTGLRYLTKQYRSCDLFLETTNVANVGDDAYNSTANGKTQYPIVADPSLTRMNQAFLRWSHERGGARLGRQELVYDNARFIGNVGWRQTHQTFDAVRAGWSPRSWLEARYTFIQRAHLVNGNHTDLDGHLINLGADAGSIGRFAAYAYLLNFDDAQAFALSTNTFGAFWTGEHELGAGPSAFDWRAEYAGQADGYDNPNTVNADYAHFVAGFGRPEIKAHVGWERLSGDSSDGRFVTVFATGHKFNGWADKFLVTPENGLQDLYVTASGKWNRLSYRATWHDFKSVSESIDYGTEIDALIDYTTQWKQVIALKAAFYAADAFATDTTKFWGFTTFNF